jgi:hypothetical protein
MEETTTKINKKPKLLQLFCKHEGAWFRKKQMFFNLRGETQYKICTKCGKVLNAVFVSND